MYLENDDKEDFPADNSVGNRECTNKNHEQTKSEGIDRPSA